MKSVIQKSIAAMLVCIALFSFVNLEAHADHYADPNSRISIYNQYLKNGVSSQYHETSGYWDDQLKSRFNLKLNSGYISGRGCALLTFAHAIQWFEGKASSDRQIEILRDLIKQSNNPPSAISTYKSYIQSRCNLDCVSMNYKSITEDQMKQLFDKDGFIVMYGSQHVSAACGYRTHNGKLYVLFVDSTCRSTLKRLNDKGASALSYELGSMANYANGSNQAGGRYWVPFDQFKRYIADYCSYWFTKKGTNSTPTSETPVISGEIKPTGSLPQGKSFGLRGTISCKYTLTNITAVVKDTVAGTEKFNVSVTPNTTSYTIGASGEQINNKIAFGTLPVGYYNYKVTATISSGTYTLIDSNFIISSQTSAGATWGATSEAQVKSSILQTGTGVTKNKVRLCAQATGDGHFVTSFWKSNLLDITSKAGGYCNRASFSMAMSYLGIDCSPVHMQELCEVDTSSNYTNVLKQLNKEKGTSIVRTTASSWNSTKLSDCYNNFNTKGNYSPVYVWGNYNSGKNTHAMIIVGKVSESGGVARYLLIDPSSKSHGVDHVLWLDINTNTGKASDSSVSNFKDYTISLILQWQNEKMPLQDDPPPLGDVISPTSVPVTPISTQPTPAPSSSRIPGDVNGDGWADSLDAFLVFKYDLGWEVNETSLPTWKNGDVNGDGIIDMLDAFLIFKYDLGWDVVLGASII